MELRNLESFIRVCESGSFSRAAEQLGYAQSTITAQIHQLEQELDGALFDRSGKRFALNQRGRTLLQYAYRITALEKEAQAQLRDTRQVRGTLRIATLESISIAFLPELLAEYLTDYPEVYVTVRTGSSTEEMGRLLTENQIDLMLALDHRLLREDWICAWEREESIDFFCAPEHPLAGQTEVPLARALETPLLVTEQDCAYRRLLMASCQELGFQPRLRVGIVSPQSVLALTQRNIGVCVLPGFVGTEAVAAGRVAPFRVRELQLRLRMQALYSRERWVPPALRAFCELLARRKA